MIAVRFSSHITHFTGTPQDCHAEGHTVAEIIADLDHQFSGLASYLIHENGSLRPHVNVFIDDRLISDREKLLDEVSAGHEVVFVQNSSGG